MSSTKKPTSEMTVAGYTNRREYINARYLLEHECGGSYAEFARRIGRASQSVNSSLNENPSRGIGPKTARAIEEAFRKPQGWLSEEHAFSTSESPPSPTVVREAPGPYAGRPPNIMRKTRPRMMFRLPLRRLESAMVRDGGDTRVFSGVNQMATDDMSFNTLMEYLSTPYSRLQLGRLHRSRKLDRFVLYVMAEGIAYTPEGDLKIEPLTPTLGTMLVTWSRLAVLIKDITGVQSGVLLAVDMGFDIDDSASYRVFKFDNFLLEDIVMDHQERGATGPLTIPAENLEDIVYET